VRFAVQPLVKSWDRNTDDPFALKIVQADALFSCEFNVKSGAGVPTSAHCSQSGKSNGQPQLC